MEFKLATFVQFHNTLVLICFLMLKNVSLIMILEIMKVYDNEFIAHKFEFGLPIFTAVEIEQSKK